jgi:hypothetical protein
MPSRASSEPNSRADWACTSSARSAKAARAPRVVKGLVSARPCGEHARSASATAVTSASRSSAAAVMRPQPAAAVASNFSPVR